MFTLLPQTSEAFEMLSWAELEPWYRELAQDKQELRFMMLFPHFRVESWIAI
jgi:DNA/RNA endonuclease G (NUC1)